MDSNDFASALFSLFGCLVSIAILAGVVALAIYAVKKGNEATKNSELMVNQIIQNLPQEKQMMFFMQFNSVKKNPTSAVLFTLFLGGVGGHKFYMGQTGLGVVYLLFCWTYIPGIIALIELFTISGQVANYNEQKAREIAMMLGGLR